MATKIARTIATMTAKTEAGATTLDIDERDRDIDPNPETAITESDTTRGTEDTRAHQTGISTKHHQKTTKRADSREDRQPQNVSQTPTTSQRA